MSFKGFWLCCGVCLWLLVLRIIFWGCNLKKTKKRGKEALDEALLKVAVGYSVEEVTEEYAEVDGEMKLLKRKETKKDIPPDLKAVQILLADGNQEISKMSDEELEKERDRLLAELQKKTLKKSVGVEKSGSDGESDGAVVAEQSGTSVAKAKKGRPKKSVESKVKKGK